MGQLTWADVRRDWAKPPNLVTYARIGLLPVIWWLILMPELLGWLGWCILLVAVLTDKVDGWLAKLHGGRWTTTLGKVLDSAADKVFILAILIAVYFKAADLSVLAAILVIGAREAVVTWVKSQMPVRSAVEAGRASMVLQSAALLWYCFPAGMGPARSVALGSHVAGYRSIAHLGVGVCGRMARRRSPGLTRGCPVPSVGAGLSPWDEYRCHRPSSLAYWLYARLDFYQDYQG